MPPKTKATGHSAKKGKALKKSARAAAVYDSDLTSGEDEPTVRDALRGLTTMMVTMSSRLDDMEGEGRKRRWVAFRDLPTASRSSGDEAAPMTASGRLVARHLAEEGDAAAATVPAASTSIQPRSPPP